MADLPMKHGLFHIPESPGDKPYLIGGRCTVCGYACFPAKKVCVKCRRDEVMEEIRLGPRGILESYAVMQVGPPDIPPPYIIGYVRTTEGVSIFTQITGCEVSDEALEVGEEMELVIDKIKEDPAGNDLLAWKFRPVKKRKCS